MVDDFRRVRRVAEQVRSHLAQQFVQDMGDPRWRSLMVTGVEVSGDLSVAWVDVRVISGDDDATTRQRILKMLSRATGRLRRSLASHLGMRRVPELRFDYDNGHDAAQRIESLLSDIERERSEHAASMPGNEGEVVEQPDVSGSPTDDA